MTLTLVFDDVAVADPALRELLGVEHFGALTFQRRARSEAMAELAQRAGAGFIHLRTPEERDALLERLRTDDSGAMFVHAPAHLAPATADDAVVTLLRQIAYSPSNLHLPLERARVRQGWSLLRGSMLRQLLLKLRDNALADFYEAHGDALVDVRDRLPLLDISDERTLLDYLSGQLDTRHFNAVARDDYTITKRSADRAKLKREYEFYQLAPPEMRMFLVQPFDFQDDGQIASYRMERLSVPDMALQWVHGAFQPHEFERFLAHIFYFLQSRPAKPATREIVHAAQEALYVRKVTERIAALKALPAYAELAPLLERACDGIDALLARYLEMFAKTRARLPADRLVIGHGDPCFSNILYSKTNQYLKLIDPRGAACETELYTDPLYDVAKLSHSVLGGYDFINQGRFHISVDEDLRPRLVLENPPPAWAAAMFASQLSAAGHDPKLVRLCEASLFISMLPLHMDRPLKVLGFALRGAAILDELADAKAWDAP